jgi:hypothetical protein
VLVNELGYLNIGRISRAIFQDVNPNV